MERIDKKALGRALRRIRMDAGLSQEDVARAMQCSRSTYSYKECGTTSFSLNDLLFLSNLFRFPPEQFFRPEFYREPLKDAASGYCPLMKKDPSQ